MKCLVFLLVLFLSMSLQAQPLCSQVFRKGTEPIPNPIQEFPDLTILLKEQKVQEVIWMLRDLDARFEADNMEYHVQTELQRLDHMIYTPKRWLEFKSNLDNSSYPSFLFQMQGFTALLKMNRKTADREALAYQIAKALKVRVPITIEVMIHGRPATAQVFIENSHSSRVQADRSYPEFANEPISLFDQLLNNWDRNASNIIVTKDAGNQSQKQIAIDNEFILSTYDPYGWLRTDPALAIAESMPGMINNYPDIHRAFSSIKVAKKVEQIIGEARVQGRTSLLFHVQRFFQTYRRIAEHYESLNSSSMVNVDHFEFNQLE